MRALPESFRRQLVHRARDAGPVGVLAAGIVLALSLVAIWHTGARFWGPCLESPDPFAWIRYACFWVVSLTALIQGWTTFEAIYRNDETRFLHPLAPAPDPWHAHVIRRVLGGHLVLLLPAISFMSPLWMTAEAPLAWTAASLVMVPLIAGVLMGTALHLRAGEESLMPAGRLKESLSGGAIRPEAALLFLSPSGAFAIPLILSVALEFVLRFGMERANWAPTGLFALGLTGGLVFSWHIGRRVFRHSMDRVLPLFIELEHVPPFREVQVPGPVWGEAILQVPGARLKAIARAEVRQLMRRHRILPLLWVGSAVLMVALDSENSFHDLLMKGIALICYLSTVLNPAFNMHSTELDHPGLWRSWPLTEGMRTRAQIAVAGYVLTPGAMLGSIGMALSGVPIAPALALGGRVLMVSLILAALTIPLARWAGPRSAGVALLSHSAIIGVGLFLLGGL